jgi:lincosamide nucleotidyltransferase A/C/D/E
MPDKPPWTAAGMSSDASWFTSGIVGGKTVPCVSAEAQRYSRSGYELRQIDLHDLAQLDATH